jgi:hypothetical protein
MIFATEIMAWGKSGLFLLTKYDISQKMSQFFSDIYKTKVCLFFELKNIYQ